MPLVKRAVDFLLKHTQDIVVLHCTSTYPTLPQNCNLRVITTLLNTFPNLVIGYSGHENGVSIAEAAVVMGASVIEKHFTLDRTMKGSGRFSGHTCPHMQPSMPFFTICSFFCFLVVRPRRKLGTRRSRAARRPRTQNRVSYGRRHQESNGRRRRCCKEAPKERGQQGCDSKGDGRHLGHAVRQGPGRWNPALRCRDCGREESFG